MQTFRATALLARKNSPAYIRVAAGANVFDKRKLLRRRK